MYTYISTKTVPNLHKSEKKNRKKWGGVPQDAKVAASQLERRHPTKPYYYEVLSSTTRVSVLYKPRSHPVLIVSVKARIEHYKR